MDRLGIDAWVEGLEIVEADAGLLGDLGKAAVTRLDDVDLALLLLALSLRALARRLCNAAAAERLRGAVWTASGA